MALKYFFRLQAKKTANSEVWDEINTINLLEKCRFYDLRGSYATKVLNTGVEIRYVADILGHRNIETTENYYISSTETSRKIATDAFDKLLQSDIINEIAKYQMF